MSKKTKAEPSATLKADYNPDVLSCLANLSNDEVFTPPEVANAMLDLLPQKIFSDPNAKFLDPACKSGVFLREIAKRLIAGLADKIPDLEKRIDHIFKEQLYAIAITELTSLLSRRSVYCSKDASGKYSVSKFKGEQGNIFYKPTKHLWINGKCLECGASQSEYGEEERQGLESHAYQFIHNAMPGEIRDMKFDVIIGNPPYQMGDGGNGASAKPIYHLFIQQAKKLNPRFLIMIIPARWYAGGKGLDEFRNEILSENHIKYLIDYNDSSDCFPGVNVAGGVCYFLYQKDYSGDCIVRNIRKNKVISEEKRRLDEFSVFVRDNFAINIIRKTKKITNDSLESTVFSRNAFDLSSNTRGKKDRQNQDDLIMFSSDGKFFIPKEAITDKNKVLEKFKVIITYAMSGGNKPGIDGKYQIISSLQILKPKEVCTETYLILATFENLTKSENMCSYIKTKFARFLLLQSLSSIHITKNTFQFVPMQDFSKPWTDQELYKKYNLSQEEIAFIESMIRPME
ncbi:MAG: Eco57I restriction-modification methylase domain-containing protein [Treponema sp.]|nr:Eco57I restriction-modification methylase domain-containing protein [Treponema sp.]